MIVHHRRGTSNDGQAKTDIHLPSISTDARRAKHRGVFQTVTIEVLESG